MFTKFFIRLFIFISLSLYSFANECTDTDPNYKLSFPRDYGQHLQYGYDDWAFISYLTDISNNIYMTQSRIMVFSNDCNYPSNTEIIFVSTITDVSNDIMYYQESMLLPTNDTIFKSKPVLLEINHSNYLRQLIDMVVYDYSITISSSSTLSVELIIPDNLLILKAGNNSIQKFANEYGVEYSQSTLETLKGSIKINDTTTPVTGYMIFNHIFMKPNPTTSHNIMYWTYLLFQYDNGYNLHVYIVKDINGKYMNESYLSLTNNVISIYLPYLTNQFTFNEKNQWISPNTNYTYTTEHLIDFDFNDTQISCKVLIQNNEIFGNNTYYEGGSISTLMMSNITSNGYGTTRIGYE